MSLVICLTWLLLFCHEAEPAVTAFGSLKPSNPTFVSESENITLKWNYTIDGSIGQAQFLNATDDSVIAAKFGDGDVNMGPKYQEQFRADISNTLAQLTILTVQRSDSGQYKFQLTSTKVNSISNEVELKVQFEASFTSSPSGDQTVNQGSNLTLFCDATGNPTPNVSWTRVLKNGTDGDVEFFGTPWVIVNISRTYIGTYRCTAYNGIGNRVSHSLYINVTYKPEIVTMVTNTTENKDCSDLWVNFTCISSEANPPVYSYLLSDDKDGFNFSESGSWILKISRGGKSTYNCTAYQLVGNVTSTNNITLSVNVPLAVGQTKNKTVHEGDNAELYCNISGIPDPTVIWTKVQDGDYNAEEGKLLNITNITRAQAGKYKCNANNTCGEESAVAYIDVQYKPENVHLTTNTTSKVCRGDVINFTCTAEANPAVHTYLLYENDTVIENMGISGTWTKEMENSGQFVFRCEANNSIHWQEIQTSDDTVLTVDVPASVEQVENKNVIEGENVEEYCNVTGGIPNPTVMWRNVKTGEHIKENPLNITNINRTQAGEYRCTANNTCGEASTVMNINVQYKPENVRLTTNTTSKVCTGVVINFTCTAEANPPVHTYLLYKNDTVIENAISRTWIKTMENAGQFVYRCTANNSIQGNQTSDDTVLTVDVPASVEQVENKNVIEGQNVEEYCNVTAGFPRPTVMWTNVKTGEHIKENPLNITNINRTQAGEYRCTANNTCGDASTVMNINVQYPPVDYREDYTIDVLEGQSKKIDCEVRGNPPPIITWYKGNDTSGIMINTSATLMFTETVFNDSGWYSCFAENFLGNLTVTVHLRVGKPSTPITSTEPMTEVVKVTKFLIKMTITNKNCDNDNPSDICEEISKEVKRIIQGNGSEEKLKDVKVENCGCGSITAYLSLDFKQSVEIPNVISVLKEAAKKGNGFGDLKVDLGSIQEISDDQLPSSTQRPSSTEESTTSGDDDDKEIPWIIIGAAAGGAIVLVVIVVVAWCVHHKRKCRRKGSKVCCSESEEQAFTPREDNDHGHVNNGYAEAGPRPTAMVDMSQHQGASVAPTYAVVDKSAKKGKMKDKKDEEKKPQTEPPQYSVVDKSKKKKKKKEEEPEATYAQVNMSKKSKKKAKPGEVLYADLGDFHQMQELPNVSTSPKALPPIKKPAPYVETQYADITQFLKGDVTLPDSNKSQGPAPGTQPAPVPENQESQEPGTSAKETSQASNPGGDGGPGHETNF